jgi:hypothetical protein
MRQQISTALLTSILALTAAFVAFNAQALPKQTLASAQFPGTSGFGDQGMRTIQIFINGVNSKDTVALANAVASPASWTILIDDNLPSPSKVQSVRVLNEGLIELTLDGPVRASVLFNHKITVWFAGNTSAALKSASIVVKIPDKKKLGQNGPFFPKLHGLTDKSWKSNLDASGSLQTGVGAKPQYQWDVTAKYPVEYNGSKYIFDFGPQFTGKASQETNADPDSLSASFVTQFFFPYFKFFKKSVPTNFSFDPVDYEFERKAEQEAVLLDGKPTLHDYQQKNSNLTVSGQIQFTASLGPDSIKKKGEAVALNLNLGTELGSAVSRSVLNTMPKSGYSDNPLRAVAGADLYFNLPKAGKYPFLSVDGHYMVRSPFHPEPFKEAGVNNGNEFYSTQARHYIAVNLARTLAPGSKLTIQYRYGSLPPTFNFVDHQATIGYALLLGGTGK